jgi:diacylglycerol kinase family enzyme
MNDEYKFVTGILYGAAAQVLQITPTIAKHIFGHNAFIIGFIKYLALYWDSFFYKRKEFIINDKHFRTNYLLINNASLISKDIEKSDMNSESKNEFSIVYLHSRLKLIQILKVFIKYHTHYRILHDNALVWKQTKSIKLEFEDEIEFLLDGEFYKDCSPIKIKFFKYPMAVISG